MSYAIVYRKKTAIVALFLYEGLFNVHKEQLFSSKSAEHHRLYAWFEVILSIWKSICQTPHCEQNTKNVTEALVCERDTGLKTVNITDIKAKLYLLNF